MRRTNNDAPRMPSTPVKGEAWPGGKTFQPAELDAWFDIVARVVASVLDRRQRLGVVCRRRGTDEP